MVQFLALFAVFFFATAVSEAGNVCTTGNVLNRPVNGQAIYWPSTWRTNETAPGLEAGQTCSWTVTIPSGYYAKLVISGKINDNSSYFKTVDTAGNIIKSTHENKEPYYFPPTKFNFIVSNEAAATLGFRITWAKFPSTLTYSAGIGATPELVNITEGVFAADYSAITGLSLLAFPADPKNYHTLRSTLVFEGKNYDGKYISNLYLLYKSRKQWISSGDIIYVVNLEARHRQDQLLVQESGYTKDITQYVEMDCAMNSTCNVSVDGGDKKTAFISVGRKTDVLNYVSINVNSFLTVYYGSQNQHGYHDSISGYDIQSNLPLTFGADIIQYVISSGKASIQYQVNP
ncbi:unnamed protein product [Caenorhabditis nigoni]